MNKGKMIQATLAVGFWGAMLHPVMIVVLAIGVYMAVKAEQAKRA